ncbi:hybrid sensor histidine kinase/response regulator [bacterium]|nr:hybrid sensor histidine kinase/response regulator [bacterium]
MLSQEEAFFKELLSMYKIEAEEHLKAISSGLIEMEKVKAKDKRKSIVETVYREAHSLKGASRAVNLEDVETVCQSMESILSLMKQDAIDTNAELFDILLKAVDVIDQLINDSEKTDISEIMNKLHSLEEGTSQEKSAEKKKEKSKKSEATPEKKEKSAEKEEEKPEAKHEPPLKEESEPEVPEEQEQPKASDSTAAPSQPVEVQKRLVSDTIRIATEKLDSLLLQAEEMLAAKLTSEQHNKDLQSLSLELEQWKKRWDSYDAEITSARHQSEIKGHNQSQGNGTLIDFLLWNQEQLKSVDTRINELIRISENNARLLGGMVNNLLEDMKKVLMLPFSTLLKILPKVVRDLSRDQGKDVELIVRGSTIEIDRRILEELKDPFIHVLRNCVDHGLEKPEERRRSGKPVTGTISITISQQSGNKVEILINDDGRGIDPERVRKVAVKKGIVIESEAAALSDEECRMLIFQSDVSTSPIITDISGRGLGLPIVREKVEKLGGSLTLESEVGVGTTFQITLPVTLATFRGIMVEVNGQVFVIPTVNVERVIRVSEGDVKTVENREAVIIDDKPLALAHLGDVLRVPKKNQTIQQTNLHQAMLLSSGEKRFVFTIDRILSEQEVLVKGLGKQLSRVRNIAGATILGTGQVVPILNVADLIKSAARITTIPTRVSKTEEAKLEKKSILVAEDSITSRTLLKNILESAGYEVKTTVDGVDALTAARAEQFDLIVSDIEMPRMNGFDLVASIRSDKRTADLPVILVTALESREDRERGIDVGANAYIVKRSFDQSNLLDVIRKLI